jgi:hypothetical protein
VSGNSLQVRLLSLGGLLITAAMILLGGIYPSYFTIIAIPVIPAPIAFGALIFRPELASKWHKTGIYLVVSILVSLACWLTELAWLSSH